MYAHPLAAVRGITLGVLISTLLFWAPIGLLIYVLVSA